MFSRASYHRFFFFNDTATTEIYTLPLHDALPIYILVNSAANFLPASMVSTTEEIWDSSLDTNLRAPFFCAQAAAPWLRRSEEHTSELQSRLHLVCRLLLEKKNSFELQNVNGPVDA